MFFVSMCHVSCFAESRIGYFAGVCRSLEWRVFYHSRSRGGRRGCLGQSEAVITSSLTNQRPGQCSSVSVIPYQSTIISNEPHQARLNTHHPQDLERGSSSQSEDDRESNQPMRRCIDESSQPSPHATPPVQLNHLWSNIHLVLIPKIHIQSSFLVIQFISMINL